MTPRQPYRSPFWRPDPTSEEAARPVSRTTRAGAHEEFGARTAPRPAAKRQTTPAPAGYGGYLASDLALFDALMPTADRVQPRPAPTAEARTASARPSDNGRPERGRTVQPPEHRYDAADDALFATLQAGFAHVRSDGRTGMDASHQPDAGPVAASHGYSQGDLEAFEKLTRFGSFR